MGIDLGKTSNLAVGPNGAIPDVLKLDVTYVVAQGKGFAAKMAAKIGSKLDLDALLLLFNNRKQVISVAGPQHLRPFPNGSVVHEGDAKAGAGGTATETVNVRLADVPSAVEGMILGVVAYGNSAAFAKLAQIVFTLRDGRGNELAQDFMTIESGVQGQLMIRIQRNGAGWTIAPFNRVVGTARRWEDMAQAARTELSR